MAIAFSLVCSIVCGLSGTALAAVAVQSSFPFVLSRAWMPTAAISYANVPFEPSLAYGLPSTLDLRGIPGLAPAPALASRADVRAPVRAVAPRDAETGHATVPSAASLPETGLSGLLRGPLWASAGRCDALVDLSGGMRQPGSQGRGNTCSVFAAAGLGEYLIKQRYGLDIDLSERYLYYSAKRDFTDAPELQVYKTVDGLAGFVAVEALSGPLLEERWWPYGDGSASTVEPASDGRPRIEAGFKDGAPYYARTGPLPRPPYEKFTGVPPKGAEKHARRDLKFSAVAIDRHRIKDFLAVERKPVAFNIMVYFNALDHKSGRLREPTDAEVRGCRESGADCGGHVILITGYDPSTREYIFRNSWGSSWGQGGYGRLSESYVVNHCEMCGYLPGLPGMSRDNQSMVVNGVHGWSADLE